MIEYTVNVYDNKTEWYLNGLKHREDGPAVEWVSGTKSWWSNGVRHREDGPAYESADGYKSWFLNGLEMTEEQFLKETSVKELSIVEIEKLLGYKVKVVR